MNKEKEEADKELNTGKETQKTDANSLGDLHFAVAAVLTLPAIMVHTLTIMVITLSLMVITLAMAWTTPTAG